MKKSSDIKYGFNTGIQYNHTTVRPIKLRKEQRLDSFRLAASLNVQGIQPSSPLIHTCSPHAEHPLGAVQLSASLCLDRIEVFVFNHVANPDYMSRLLLGMH